MTCKSPTHRQYEEAVESLKVHAQLAIGELQAAIDKAASASTEATPIPVDTGALVDVEERLAHARAGYANAVRAVDNHLSRYCANLA